MIAEIIAKRGTAFDLAAFLANILLVYPLADLVKQTQGESPIFTGLLLAAAGLHAIGAYFKRRPLHARMAEKNSPAMGGGGYILFLTLAVMHYAVFAMCIMVGLKGMGMTEPCIVLGGALIPTGMAVAALIPPRGKEAFTTALRQKDLLGNLLVYGSTVIILAWWDGFWVEYLATANRINIFMSLLLFVLSTVPFAIFYLAPRMILLREDYRHKQTWINALIVMLPLATRLIFRN